MFLCILHIFHLHRLLASISQNNQNHATALTLFPFFVILKEKGVFYLIPTWKQIIGTKENPENDYVVFSEHHLSKPHVTWEDISPEAKAILQQRHDTLLEMAKKEAFDYLAPENGICSVSSEENYFPCYEEMTGEWFISSEYYSYYSGDGSWWLKKDQPAYNISIMLTFVGTHPNTKDYLSLDIWFVCDTPDGEFEIYGLDQSC